MSRKSKEVILKPLTWSEVYRYLPDEETRSWCIRGLKEHGFSSGSNWGCKPSRVALCEVLTKLEDKLELEHIKGNSLRRGLQSIRRRLEWEIYS